MKPSNDLSDEDLMRAYIQGNAAAFDVLFARHEPALLRFIGRLLGPRLISQKEEVFQEAWMKIIGARVSFEPQAARWRTWAFTIAHNSAMDCLRKSGREPATVDLANIHADDVTWGQFADESALSISLEMLEMARADTPEEKTYWRRAGQRLLLCLEELPDEQRAAFLLRHEQDWPMEEIASHLNIALEALRSRVRYATQKLRKCMGSYLHALEGAA